jgi:two-component system, sensor histidine kinase and response regulator
MNDHVVKPIEPRDLLVTLTRWITPRTPVEGQGVSAPPGGRPPDPGLPDHLPGVDIEAAVARLSGNRTLLVRLLRDYCHTYREVADNIRTAFEEGDFDAAKRIAHTLKGASGNLSITRVQKVSGNLEGALARGGREAVNTLIVEPAGVLSPILTGEFKKEDDTSREMVLEGGTEDITTLLTEFCYHLVRRSLKARRLFVTLKRQIRTTGGDGSLELCEDALNNLDFSGAPSNRFRPLPLQREFSSWKRHVKTVSEDRHEP